MKIFEKPVIELIRFNENDVIVTSSTNCGGSSCLNESVEDDFG